MGNIFKMKKRTNMLQNEAIAVVLNYFENNTNKVELGDDLCTALQILKKIRENNAILGWKQLGAIIAIERYLDKNDGNFSRIHEISGDEQFPGARTFRKLFGVPIYHWMMNNYPEYTRKSSTQYFYGGFRYKSAEEVQKSFINEYLRLKPTGQDDFNKRKSQTIPTWRTMAAMHNLTSWNKLIDKLELPRYGPEHVRWNEDIMCERMDAFVAQKHRVPTFKEMKSHNGLPAPYVIEKFGKQKCRLWLQARYPEYVHESWQLDLLANRTMSRRRWIALFKEEYTRIRPTSGLQYNENRTKGTPAWGTIAKFIGENPKRWNDFKVATGVIGIPIPPKEKPKTQYNVSVYIKDPHEE